jgi:hypothetical protein
VRKELLAPNLYGSSYAEDFEVANFQVLEKIFCSPQMSVLEMEAWMILKKVGGVVGGD